MDEHHYNPIDIWDNGVYGTGPTQPPKNNNGMIALLLITVIFLSGLVSVLSFMNIRLFQQLQQEKLEDVPAAPIAFAEGNLSDDDYDVGAYSEGETVLIPKLNISVYSVTDFDQNYFQWPPGLMVVEAKENVLGLEEGDIILHIGTEPVTDPNTLNAWLASGETFSVTVQRADTQQTIQYIP